MAGHRPLRGGRKPDGGGDDPVCGGNLAPFAIRRHEWLGVSGWTDVFELQLRTLGSLAPPQRAVAYSVAAALRDSLAEHLGIDSRELGCAAVPSRVAAEQAGWSAVVYDRATGGAGFSSSAPEHLPELIQAAARRLKCPRRCEAACQSCLLSHDTQYAYEHLDRHQALELLSREVLESLRLREDRAIFGPRSALELTALPQALRREAQTRAFEVLRLFLGGSGAEWDVEDWNLRPEILRWAAEGRRIQIFVASGAKADLAESAGTFLADLASLAEIELLESSEETWRQGAGYRIAEMIAPKRSVRWGVLSPRALRPGAEWGISPDQGALIRHVVGEAVAAPDSSYLSTEALRPATPTGSVRILVLAELDGPVRSFGHRFWKEIAEHSASFRSCTEAGRPLARISYQDRFLHSPQVVLLFISVLNELAQLGLVGPGTELDVLTSLPNHHRRRPWATHHNWGESEQIGAVLRATLGKLFGDGYALSVHPRPETPHHRLLDLTRDDGNRFSVTLDQGFGYWRSQDDVRFPFGQPIERQVRELSRARYTVQGASDRFSTYLFVPA